jgi:hypothetical protein
LIVAQRFTHIPCGRSFPDSGMICRIFICVVLTQRVFGGRSMIRTLMAVLFILCAIVSVASADGIRPGYWQLVSTMEMQDVPVQLTPTSARYCISAAEAGDPRRIVFRLKECTITAFSSVGNRISWKMSCGGTTPGTLNGEAVLKGDSFRSFMKMRSRGNTMNMSVKAKRLGDCPYQK